MRTLTRAMYLPTELELLRDDIEAALLEPIPGAWPDDAVYVNALPALQLGRLLVHALHRHLETARIAFVFKEKITGHGDKLTLATAQRAGAKLSFFAEIDFVLEVNWTTWRHLEPFQKVALIDHELRHMVRDEEGRWRTAGHDVEEFGDIVRRWGLWKGDLRTFGMIVRQVELFDVEQPV